MFSASPRKTVFDASAEDETTDVDAVAPTWPPPPPPPGGYVLEPVVRHADPAIACPPGYELGASEYAATPDEPIGVRLAAWFDLQIPQVMA